MIAQEHFIKYGNSRLQYFKSGSGPEPLLAFHGFGQDNTAFDSIHLSLTNQYTWYVFNLFFHGDSIWAEGEKPLEQHVLKKIFSQFFSENNINNISLAGFSLGGKFALTITSLFPDKINTLFLIAPDGVSTTFWYNLATYPLLFRRIFKSMIHHPAILEQLIRFARFLKIADKSLLRFVEYQMNTEDKRKQVYYSWVVFRKLQPGLKKVAASMNDHNIQLVMITGRHDRVIRPAKMKKLLKHVKKYEHVVLNTGHNELIKNSADALKSNAFSFEKTEK